MGGDWYVVEQFEDGTAWLAGGHDFPTTFSGWEEAEIWIEAVYTAAVRAQYAAGEHGRLVAVCAFTPYYIRRFEDGE